MAKSSVAMSPTGPRAIVPECAAVLAPRHAGREAGWLAACSFGPFMRPNPAWLLIALFSAGVWSAPLAAQSSSAGDAPKPEAVLLNGAAPIPANGSLLLSGQSESRLGSLSLKDTGGVAITGTLSKTGQYFVWKPQRPLVPGSYRFVVEDPNGNYPATTYPIEVQPAASRARPKLSSSVQLQRLDARFSGLCCSVDDPSLRIVPSCFDTILRRTAALTVTLASDASASELGQLLVSVIPVGGFTKPSEYRPFTGQLTHLMEWEKKADEYCFDVYGIEIGTKLSLTYPDLTPRCAPHGSLGGLEPETLVPGASEIGHEHCPVPPPGYEARWCEINGQACAADRAQPTCHSYARLCLDAPAAASGSAGAASNHPAASMPVSGDIAGSSAPSQTTDAAPIAGAQRAASLPTAEAPRRHPAGCSPIAQVASAQPFAVTMLLALAAWIVRRRRASASKSDP